MRPPFRPALGDSVGGGTKLPHQMHVLKKPGSLSPRTANIAPFLSGVTAAFFCDLEKQAHAFKVSSVMKRKSMHRHPEEIVKAIVDLAKECSECASELSVRSELKFPETGQLCRSSPIHGDKPWCDWAMSQVSDRVQAVQIRCFVDLSFFPANNNTNHALGVCMIVEPAKVRSDREELLLSDFFIPIHKEEGHGSPNKLLFLSVDAIVGPACVIPDLGNANKRACLRARPVTSWADQFESWVLTPHLREHQEPLIGE